jgi:transposase
MTIIGGLDVHRAQITFDYLDTETGEIFTGQIRPASRSAFREWLGGRRFGGCADVRLAVEGCTGWRFIVEEMQRAGVRPHLAEPAETASRRGRKRRAKTDKADARLLRNLLLEDRLPESWIPPQLVLEARILARLYLSLSADRSAWLQRIHAQLYHQGVPAIETLLTGDGCAKLVEAALSPAGRQAVLTATATIQALDQQREPLRAQLQALARRLPGPRALTAHFGIGPLTAAVIWCEMGDCRRFRNSDQVVRLAAWTSRSGPQTANARPADWPARAHRLYAGRSLKRPRRQPGLPHPTMTSTRRRGSGSTPNAPPSPWPASWPDAAITPCVTSAPRRFPMQMKLPRLPDL